MTIRIKNSQYDLERAQGLQNALFNLEKEPNDNLDKTSKDG